MHEFGDVRMAFGESDEMSFILNKASTLYGEVTFRWHVLKRLRCVQYPVHNQCRDEALSMPK